MLKDGVRYGACEVISKRFVIVTSMSLTNVSPNVNQKALSPKINLTKIVFTISLSAVRNFAYETPSIDEAAARLKIALIDLRVKYGKRSAFSYCSRLDSCCWNWHPHLRD